jgi:hypothetical protein
MTSAEATGRCKTPSSINAHSRGAGGSSRVSTDCRASRAPGAEHQYSAERRDDPAVTLTAADPGGLRELIRADYFARPVSREVTP